MVGLWLGVLLAQTPSALVLENDRLSVRVHRHQGVFQEEMAVLTQAGRRVVLVSPGSLRTDPGASPLDGLGWWSFRDARRLGQSLLLTGSGVERVIRLSPDGAEVLVTTRVHGRESARSLMTAYAFRPDGQAAPGAQSYSTGPRTREGLVAEDSIRAPVVWARWNELGAAILLETDQDRPVPLAMLAGGSPGSTLLGAGMAHVVMGAGEQWVWSERPARLPDGPVEWRVRILLTSEADQVPVSSLASSRTWPAYREPHHALPQVAPFADYARQALGDQNSGFWSEGEVGAPASRDGKVRLGNSANLVLSAWGKRWWGEYLNQTHLVDQSDRMVRLALQGLQENGAPARVFDIQTRQWSSLPAGFDTREAAWTGIWLWHYARDSQNSELRREARRAAVGIARLLASRLSPNGRLSGVWTGSPDDRSDPTDSAPAVWLFQLVGMEQQALLGMNGLLTEAVDRGEFGSRGGPDELVRLGWTLGALLADESIGHERAIQNVVDRIALLQRVWEPGDEPQPSLKGLIAPSSGTATAGLAEHVWVAPLLVEAGLRTNRRDLAERGASMARAVLAFLPHPLARANGLSGLPSAGFRIRGRGGFVPSTGFIENEGAILAGLAMLTADHGGAVRSRNGWVVGIDGCAVDESGQLVDLLAANPVPYGQARQVRIVGPGPGEVTELELPPRTGIRAISARMVREGVQVIATPTVSSAAQGTGRFVMSGSAWVASPGEQGFQKVLPVLGLSESTVLFEGEAGGRPLRSVPSPIHINPEWVRPRWPDPGWTRSDGLRPGALFGLEHWSTADRGFGTVERHLQGVLQSPEFIVAQERLVFTLHGVPDPRCSVELVLVESGQVVHRSTVSLAEPQRIEVDATGFAGRRLRLRLVDRSRIGWVGVSGVGVAGVLIPDD